MKNNDNLVICNTIFLEYSYYILDFISFNILYYK